MDKETKKDLKDIAIKFFIALSIALIIVAIGISESWLIIPSLPVLTGGAAYFASKKSLKATVAWGIIGLLSGIGFYLAI